MRLISRLVYAAPAAGAGAWADAGAASTFAGAAGASTPGASVDAAAAAATGGGGGATASLGGAARELCLLRLLLRGTSGPAKMGGTTGGSSRGAARGLALPSEPRLVGDSRGRSLTGSQNVAKGPRASSSALSAGSRHVLRVLGGASARGSESDL